MIVKQYSGSFSLPYLMKECLDTSWCYDILYTQIESVVIAKTFLKTCIVSVHGAVSRPCKSDEVFVIVLFTHQCNCWLAVGSFAILSCSTVCMYDGQPRGSQDRGESRKAPTSVSVLRVPLLFFLASENKLS